MKTTVGEWLLHFIVTECLFWKVSNLNVFCLDKGAVLGRTLKVTLTLNTTGKLIQVCVCAMSSFTTRVVFIYM